ncbi:MAG: hypothetical protein WA146_02580 [Thiobacillus sp.]
MLEIGKVEGAVGVGMDAEEHAFLRKRGFPWRAAAPVAPPIPRMDSFLLLFTLLAWLIHVHGDDEHLFQIWRRGDLMALMFHHSAS